MVRPSNLILSIGGLNERVEIPGVLDDNLADLLIDYVAYADELVHIGFVKERYTASLQLHWVAQNQEMLVTATLPPWDDVVVLLTRLRPFVLKSERTYFRFVRNQLCQTLQDGRIRGVLQHQLEIYSVKSVRSTVVFRLMTS